MNKEDYSKYYVQGSDHYLIPKDVFDELLAENKELELIIGLRQERNLISKFDKEYDEEDKKKNPNRDYAGIMPDAEEVYKRYYSMKKQQKEFINYLESEIDRCLTFYSSTPCMYAYDVFKDVLSKYQEIIEVKNER